MPGQNKNKKRENKRKTQRLEHQRRVNQLSAARKRLRADVGVVAMRLVQEEELVFFVRRGLFGHKNNVLLRVNDIELAGCAEDPSELAKLVNNVGILVVSQMFGHNLAEGVTTLGKTVAAWAGIDLTGLHAEAAAEEQPALPAPTEEPST